MWFLVLFRTLCNRLCLLSGDLSSNSIVGPLKLIQEGNNSIIKMINMHAVNRNLLNFAKVLWACVCVGGGCEILLPQSVGYLYKFCEYLKFSWFHFLFMFCRRLRNFLRPLLHLVSLRVPSRSILKSIRPFDVPWWHRVPS